MTTASLEAAAAAALAADPKLAAILRRVARDEERHATLAFAVLRFALARANHRERARIVDLIDLASSNFTTQVVPSGSREAALSSEKSCCAVMEGSRATIVARW